MLALNDGRNELWQWDTGRKLTVDADCSQVHFSNKVFGRSIDVDVVDGIAIIPDILLQTDKDLTAWAFVGTAENGYTKISKVFKVNKRNKPADYVFTPPEQTSIEEIKEKIEYLESIQDPDAIKNAVDEYLANNPIQIDEKDPTVPDWAKQTTKPKYTATEVGAVAKVNGVKPDANGNVEITIPDSGGNVDQVVVEPAYDDIPKVFFGGALQQTKDEAVVPFRYISKTDDFSGYAEIKAQGNSSMSHPKKNQTVKMFKDADCTEKLKTDFKGWGKQNKFCFKANWIDLTHARNVVSARLWADVVKSRANYADLPELLKTAPNQGAVDGFPVKVYADGVYQGRYTLNIPKDAWMANMDKDLDTHCILCGEGSESGKFRAPASINGSDWSDEIHDTVPTSIKTRWNEVISFVMNSTDAEFEENLWQYFDVPSLIDYHLFGLASCGFDAYHKNQIYMTYDGQRWFASMYDMDSTWGLWWTGEYFVDVDYEFDNLADGGNLLYMRLQKVFYVELQSRWAELRNGALSIENIINRFERFTDIAPTELVKEDYASTTGDGKFTGIPSRNSNNIQQIRSFALARRVWVDEYVAGLTPVLPVPCEGITLDKKTLIFTAEGTQTLTATVTPDGCTDKITWTSNNANVATVNGGVVSAIANGEAVITVRCGNYSATCNVSVSGIAVDINYTWSDTGEHQLDDAGQVISGDCYVTELFDIPAGKYRFVNTGKANMYAEFVTYDASGVLVKKNVINNVAPGSASAYVDVFDFDGVGQARLVAHVRELDTIDNCVLETGGIWCGSNIYSVNSDTGEIFVKTTPGSGDFVTLKRIPVIGGLTYSFANKDDGTFNWKGVLEWASDGTFIKKTQQGSETSAHVVTVTANTAYVYLQAANGTDPDNKLEFTLVE